jgi:hypothetical protein
MKTGRINWPLWLGFLLTFVSGLSFPLVFAWYPVTRDFPWANLLLFLLAAVLLVVAVRRGFARDRARPKLSKVVTSLVTTLSALVFAFFIFAIFIAARWLPASTGAPHVGQKVPEFTLSDANGQQVSLNQLLSEPIDGKTPKGVLLIFYRGYW